MAETISDMLPLLYQNCRPAKGARDDETMIASRRKGKHGEQEVAGMLSVLFETDVTRNLVQCRDGGCDLLGLPGGWSAEVKRAATPRVPEWWRQTVGQANGAKPVLLYRTDRRAWRAVIALVDAVSDLGGQARDDITWTVEVSLPVFAALVREGQEP